MAKSFSRLEMHDIYRVMGAKKRERVREKFMEYVIQSLYNNAHVHKIGDACYIRLTRVNIIASASCSSFAHYPNGRHWHWSSLNITCPCIGAQHNFLHTSVWVDSVGLCRLQSAIVRLKTINSQTQLNVAFPKKKTTKKTRHNSQDEVSLCITARDCAQKYCVSKCKFRPHHTVDYHFKENTLCPKVIPTLFLKLLNSGQFFIGFSSYMNSVLLGSPLREKLHIFR
jgi:hypothetical protein